MLIRTLIITTFALFFCNQLCLGNEATLELQVSQNGRHLETENGEPFFWLADTAWELLHRLDENESKRYLKDRAAKGFTVIQTVVLAELDGLQTPNSNGDLPLIDLDPSQPNEAYFRHIDKVLQEAKKLGLVIGLLPTWGDKWQLQSWGKGPLVFTPENAKQFAEFLALRYQDYPIVWILGGDRSPVTQSEYAIIDAMAAGIRKANGNRQLITYHPSGEKSSHQFFHDRDWLDFNLFQSGHGLPHNQNYLLVAEALRQEPMKPVIDGEPCYEDLPIAFRPTNGWFTDFETRRAFYWSMLEGAAGHSYGHHGIWQMLSPETTPISAARTNWIQALDYPGAFQVCHGKELLESMPWQSLKPFPNLISGYLRDPRATPKFALDEKSGNGVAYLPYGDGFLLNLSSVQDHKLSADWFDPRSGRRIAIGPLEDLEDPIAFDPPFERAEGNDWVLHIYPHSTSENL